jgi:hypothetical protein
METWLTSHTIFAALATFALVGVCFASTCADYLHRTRPRTGRNRIGTIPRFAQEQALSQDSADRTASLDRLAELARAA